jgi:hypothetical protein
MSYSLRIICRSSDQLLRSHLIRFIEEGVYFDNPRFEPAIHDNEADDPEWHSLTVHYQESRRPIIFHRNVMDGLLSSEVKELLEELADKGRGDDERIRTALRDAKQVIAIEVDPESLTADAWQMLDCIEAHIATTLNGIVYAPDGGYFDERLQRM